MSVSSRRFETANARRKSSHDEILPRDRFARTALRVDALGNAVSDVT